MVWIVSQARTHLTRGELRALGGLLVRAATERYYERWFDIRSGGYVSPDDLGHRTNDHIGYEGTDYLSLRHVLSHLRITPADVFLDFGAGKGRAVIVAATRPFKRVTGIELAPDLVAQAHANIERARKRLTCKDVTVVPADAATYAIPDDVNVVFMFNPFRGELLARVLGNLKQSLDRAPRHIRVAFVNPRHMDAGMESVIEGWLRKTEVLRPWAAEFDTVIYETTRAQS